MKAPKLGWVVFVVFVLASAGGCYASHAAPVDADAGNVAAPAADAAPCDVVPVYAHRACVGIGCDFCPGAGAAFLARAGALGCCVPFRCSWPVGLTVDGAEAQLGAAESCDELVDVSQALRGPEDR